MRLRRSDAFDWRDHIGGEVALLALLGVTGAVLSFWQSSRLGEEEIDARTRARLRPGASPAVTSTPDDPAKAS
jgi:hypothetical protein